MFRVLKFETQDYRQYTIFFRKSCVHCGQSTTQLCLAKNQPGSMMVETISLAHAWASVKSYLSRYGLCTNDGSKMLCQHCHAEIDTETLSTLIGHPSLTPLSLPGLAFVDENGGLNWFGSVAESDLEPYVEHWYEATAPLFQRSVSAVQYSKRTRTTTD